MNHYYFTDEPREQYPIVILVPRISVDEIHKHYIKAYDLCEDTVLVLDLFQKPGAKKTPVKDIKEYLNAELVESLNQVKAEYVLCTDAEYFKVLTGTKKVDACTGYVMDSAFGSWKVIYVPSYKSKFYDPTGYTAKANQAFAALKNHVEGTYEVPGTGILKDAHYLYNYFDIQQALTDLVLMDKDLTCDIEAFGLKHFDAGIATISFSWDKHSGVSFPVDYVSLDTPVDGVYGKRVHNEPVRKLLQWFFETFKRKIIYHNISYDAYVLIYQLFMKDILDGEGMLHGMDMMLENWDDTKLITYLATNECGGNSLGLKDQSQEFAGDYAEEDIKDVRKIPLDRLLEYNLVDACATWFTYEKNHPIMVRDQQEDVYTNIFKPAIKDIIQMQLTGMPLNMARVKEVKKELQHDNDHALKRIHGSYMVQELVHQRKIDWVEWRNSELKTKKETMGTAEVRYLKEVAGDTKEKHIAFNPNSPNQLGRLLYEQIGLPVIETTKTGLPACDGDTIKNLKNHTKDPKVLALLDAFVDYAAVNKILTSFIPAMENAAQGPDGWHYLFGNFNLGGTVSGRLSSSNPNLQNLPATGSKYAKTIKECFEAPPGWLFIGLDFASLEDRISALTTKDPNKLRVYLDGFDGHCLRAHAYFGDQMSDIELAPSEVLCYKANVGGTDVYFHANEDVEYMGQKMKGHELYELLACQGV